MLVPAAFAQTSGGAPQEVALKPQLADEPRSPSAYAAALLRFLTSAGYRR